MVNFDELSGSTTIAAGLKGVQLTTVAEFANELAELNKQYKKRIQEEGEKVLTAGFKIIFDENPDLVGVRWTQYTPYFNDGDECTFGINEPEFKITGKTDDKQSDWDEDEGWTSDLTYRKYVELTDEQKAIIDGETVPYYERPTVEGKTVRAEVDYNNPIYGQKNRYGYSRATYAKTGLYYIDAPIEGIEKLEADVQQIFTIPSEVFKDVFGDHSRIVVTRDNIEIEEYEHE